MPAWKAVQEMGSRQFTWGERINKVSLCYPWWGFLRVYNDVFNQNERASNEAKIHKWSGWRVSVLPCDWFNSLGQKVHLVHIYMYICINIINARNKQSQSNPTAAGQNSALGQRLFSSDTFSTVRDPSHSLSNALTVWWKCFYMSALVFDSIPGMSRTTTTTTTKKHQILLCFKFLF